MLDEETSYYVSMEFIALTDRDSNKHAEQLQSISTVLDSIYVLTKNVTMIDYKAATFVYNMKHDAIKKYVTIIDLSQEVDNTIRIAIKLVPLADHIASEDHISLAFVPITKRENKDSSIHPLIEQETLVDFDKLYEITFKHKNPLLLEELYGMVPYSVLLGRTVDANSYEEAVNNFLDNLFGIWLAHPPVADTITMHYDIGIARRDPQTIQSFREKNILDYQDYMLEIIKEPQAEEVTFHVYGKEDNPDRPQEKEARNDS